MNGGPPYDLWFDPNGVDGNLVVECWISHGPRAGDAAFDPQPGNELLVGDDEEEPSRAFVIRRDGDRVWVRIDLHAKAIGFVGRHKGSGASD